MGKLINLAKVLVHVDRAKLDHSDIDVAVGASWSLGSSSAGLQMENRPGQCGHPEKLFISHFRHQAGGLDFSWSWVA